MKNPISVYHFSWKRIHISYILTESWFVYGHIHHHFQICILYLPILLNVCFEFATLDFHNTWRSHHLEIRRKCVPSNRIPKPISCLTYTLGYRAQHHFDEEKQRYSDVIMGLMASQITSLTIVYSTVYSGADQRRHQIPRTNGQWRRNCFHLMTSSWRKHTAKPNHPQHVLCFPIESTWTTTVGPMNQLVNKINAEIPLIHRVL